MKQLLDRLVKHKDHVRLRGYDETSKEYIHPKQQQAQCDLSIIVCGERRRAHKEILSKESLFFKHILATGEYVCIFDGDKAYEFPEADKAALNRMLEFMYMQTWNFDTVIAVGVEWLVRTMRLAEKYGVCHLLYYGEMSFEDLGLEKRENCQILTFRNYVRKAYSEDWPQCLKIWLARAAAQRRERSGFEPIQMQYYEVGVNIDCESMKGILDIIEAQVRNLTDGAREQK
ncbi:hypothetical protein BDV25DRAFT_135550 [Aspergillus avenaceus]|uniref:BTB domain-containing protein n=1 Tax=Aspergillus avenaceus TaxID=36643 RepID=A0A5N6U8G7_ASPAV|nr:hypothetical protein BDV25DRAFT_135550 [Aspergillus avenaceus]